MPSIYIDMDGVVADFNTAAQNFLNQDQAASDAAAQAGRWPPEEWNRLKDQHNFYRHLPKMPRADDMMALAKKFQDELGWKLRMLTAIPKGNDMPEVFQDKILWMQEHYPGVRVCFGPYSYDKARHCQPGDILVDDRRDNCDQWTAAGGIAVRVTKDYDLALEQLEILYRKNY